MDSYKNTKQCDQSDCMWCKNEICVNPDDLVYDHCFGTERWEQYIKDNNPICVLPSIRQRLQPIIIQSFNTKINLEVLDMVDKTKKSYTSPAFKMSEIHLKNDISKLR